MYLVVTAAHEHSFELNKNAYSVKTQRSFNLKIAESFLQEYEIFYLKFTNLNLKKVQHNGKQMINSYFKN